ncbi:MAG: hypothetical protein LBM04_00100 [Opitutaceae bacterium]|jgi:hypothetical protein|nr:hypothetical protein [Opitutaceae bacterium]
MNTIQTLLLRDLRRAWPLAGAWMIFAFVFFAYPTEVFRSKFFLFYEFFPIIVWGTWTVLLGFIVHDALPSGSSEFWMTRPISGRQLFAAKMICIVILCVCLPVLVMAAAKMLGLVLWQWLLDAEWHLSVLLIFPRLFMIALSLMVVASLTRNTLQYLLSLFFIGFGAILLTAKYITRITRITPYSEKHTAMQHPNLFEWTIVTMALLGLLFIIYRQYTKRNRIATLASCVALGIVLLGIWKMWPVIPLD